MQVLTVNPRFYPSAEKHPLLLLPQVMMIRCVRWLGSGGELLS